MALYDQPHDEQVRALAIYEHLDWLEGQRLRVP